MPGIRIQHPSLRNCTYTLIHYGRPLKAPIACRVCGLTHHHKTYHLALDALGEVVVSETVYARLKEAGLDELQAVSEVARPEPQRIVMNGNAPTLVVSRENGGSHG